MSSPKKKGSKQEVYDGLALCTSGGLKKDDLMLNAKGQVVSKKRSEQGKKQYQNLKKSRPEEPLAEGGKPNQEPPPPIAKPNEEPKPAIQPQAAVLAPEESKENECKYPIPKFDEPNPEPKKKVRKYSNRKIKSENPMIDEIQHGDKI